MDAPVKKKKRKPKKRDIRKIYGHHTFWEVFSHNLLKLLAVDILSKSFVALVASSIMTASFLSHQLMVEKQNLEWLELLVAITPPTFLALYWIERHTAAAVLEAVAQWIRNRK
jgi:hypothetical protein